MSDDEIKDLEEEELEPKEGEEGFDPEALEDEDEMLGDFDEESADAF